MTNPRSHTARRVAAVLCLGMGLSAAPAQSAVEAWVQRYSHPVSYSDQPLKVVTDNADNVIVVGQSDERITGSDFVIVKHSSAGVTLWSQHCNGPGNSEDYPQAVAVDASGNVFVAGYSILNTTSADYLTVACSSAGVPLWTNLYSGPGNSDDRAFAVAVDANGNVFVTGSSWDGTNGATSDYVTIKYSAAGVPLWTNRYNGPDNYADAAKAVAVDRNGNVVVTGNSSRLGRGADYATVAYSAAGVPLWTNRYDGPGNFFDNPTAVTVDGNGNVFVTGRSWSGSSYDYATLAYSSAGVPLWTNRYNGAGNIPDGASALAVDDSGNLYVTGTSGIDPNTDYATVAYSGAGAPLWTNRYNGPSNVANAVAVDRSGNVFVTGNLATIAYSVAGVPLWTNSGSGIAIAVDGSGEVVVTGQTAQLGGDYATFKYSGAGVPLWTNRYRGTRNADDFATAVVAGGSGKVFVTGYSAANWVLPNYDYATVAYSDAGVPLWTNRYNGPGNADDKAVAMAVDGSGNVFVTGSSANAIVNPINLDYATVAYSEQGVPLWTNRYSGPGSLDDQAVAVAVAGGGNVIVTGSSYASAGNSDYATVAYSGTGFPLWTNRYNGPANNHDQANALVVDSSGNIYVTGQSRGIGSEFDYATVAYTGAGVPLWTNRYDGPGRYVDRAYAVGVDNAGNVFVTGSSSRTNQFPINLDYATVAYSSAGLPLWTNRYSEQGISDEEATAIAVDGSGSGKVFVTGYAIGTSGTYEHDFVTVAYSAAGVPVWTNKYNGPGNTDEFPYAAAVDGSGNVFVTGASYATNGWRDYVTVAYSGAGVPLWTNRYDGAANGDDVAARLAIGPDGAVYVTGFSDGNFAGKNTFDFATIKYVNTSWMPIRLHSQIVGSQLVLSWTNAAFSLQSAPAVQGPYADVPGAMSPHSTPFSGAQRFFRLKGN